MRAPQTKKVGSVTYIETDLIITNALPGVVKDNGGSPIVWQILSGTTVSSEKYRFIRPTILLASAQLINENEPDVCCGTVVAKQNTSKIISTFKIVGATNGLTPTITSGVDINAGPTVFENVLEVPKFQARGIVTSRLLGAGVNDLFVGNQNLGSVSKEEIIRRWKSYLENTTDTGTQLFWVDPTNNKRTQLKTWDEIVDKYASYFYHESEMNRQAQSSLSGSLNPKGFFAVEHGIEETNAGLWATFKSRGLSTEAIKRELLDSGYTTAQLNTFLNQPKSSITLPGGVGSNSSGGSGGSGGSGSGSGGSGSGGRNRQVDDGLPGIDVGPPTTITIQRSRNIFANNTEVNNSFIIKNNSEKDRYLSAPQIFQLVPSINERWGYLEYIPNRYIFIHRPNEIQYSGLGGEWVTIDRTGGFAFVDWKKFQLLQISFSFVIAKDGDGLIQHVEEEIKSLRQISQTPYPVSFFNFDSMFTQQFRYDNEGNTRGIQFAITDFSINAQQRDSTMRVTRAQANMTLQEIPIEKQTLISMPRLTSKKIIKPPNPGEDESTFRLPSDANTTGYAADVPWVPNPPGDGG